MTIETQSNEPKIETPPVKADEVKPTVQAGSESVAENNTPAEITSAESEAVEPEASNESEAESTESEPEGTEAEDLASKEPVKKKSGIQRRVNKLNQRISAKEQEAISAKQEAEYWKQQALKNANESKKETPVETQQLTTYGKPRQEDYDTHEAYDEAKYKWRRQQERAEEASQRAQTEQAIRVQTYFEKRDEFKTTHSDFDELMEDVSEIPVSLAVQDIIISSENGPELAYELAKNKEEFARINKLPPLAAARELGRLEAKFSSQASQEKKTETKTTKAPAPLAPVRGSGAPIPKSLDEAANHSFAAYKKLREADLKKQGRRI